MRNGTLEVSLYVVCALCTAAMIHVPYAAGYPPPLFWLLASVSAIGLVRIFQIAWREDRADKGD